MLEKAVREELSNYAENVRDCTIKLHGEVKQMYEGSTVLERVLHYLEQCPEEDYQRILRDVNEFWSQFAMQEEKKALESLYKQIEKAERKAAMQNSREGKQVMRESPIGSKQKN